MKTTSRILVCVLGAIFIFSSLGAVYAVDPSPSPTPGYDLNDGLPNAFEQLVPYYIWLCMRAWGIQISFEDSLEYQNAVGDAIWNWVIEYLASLPSAYSINEWIAPWQSSYDYWGNYQFNESALEDIQDFVDWLCDKFGITSNSTVIIDPVYSLNGNYTLYKFDNFYALYDDNDVQSDTYAAWEVIDHDPGDLIGYFQLYVIGPYGSQWQHWAVNDESVTVYLGFITIDNNGQQSAGGNMNTTLNDGPSQHGVYYEEIGNPPQNRHLSGDYPILNGTSEYNAFFQGLQIVREGNNKFITSSLNLPISDPDYTEGDSIVIIGDKPSYQVIEWSGEVTVSNLPAIVSTGSIPVPGDELNPGLVNAWHPISTLIEMTADSMGMLIGIVYEFPEEVLIPIFAVLGGIIIFGIIHAMKEH